MSKIIRILLVLALLTTGVVSQNSTTSSSINIIIPSTTSSATSSSSASPTSDPTNGGGDDVQPILCTPGNSVGYMLIRKPNITSMVMVGTQYNVTWDWSISVTKPPSYVDVYVQLIATGITPTWKKQVAQKVPADPRWFYWKPDGMVDGKYKIRLVPDGKETYNVPANMQPCFANGEAIPSVSAAFTVTNSKGDLSNYPDQFPPNDAKKLIAGVGGVMDFRIMMVIYVLFGIWMTM